MWNDDDRRSPPKGEEAWEERQRCLREDADVVLTTGFVRDTML